MSDARSRYERWTKDQLVEEMVKFHRGRTDDQLHRAAIKRDLARAEALQEVSIKELDAWFGAPLLRELILACHHLKEAGEALSSPPMENTMRVSHPDSSKDEGAATRTYRNLKQPVKGRIERTIKHISRTTESIGRDLDRDEDLSEKRRWAAHHSNHKQGYHDGKPNDECPKCREEHRERNTWL